MGGETNITGSSGNISRRAGFIDNASSTQGSEHTESKYIRASTELIVSDTKGIHSKGVKVGLRIIAAIGRPFYGIKKLASHMSSAYREYRNARDTNKSLCHQQKFQSIQKTKPLSLSYVKGGIPLRQEFHKLHADESRTCLKEVMIKSAPNAYEAKMTRGIIKLLSEKVGPEKAKEVLNSAEGKEVISKIIALVDEGASSLESAFEGEVSPSKTILKDAGLNIDNLKQLKGIFEEATGKEGRDVNIKSLASNLRKLNKILESGDIGNSKQLKQDFLKAMYGALSNPLYIQAKEDEGNPVVSFLHDLSERFYFEAGGLDSMENFMEDSNKVAIMDGTLKLAETADAQKGGLGDMGDHLGKLLDSSLNHSINKESISGKVAYAMSCPDRIAGSHASNKKLGGDYKYDALAVGNDVITSGTMHHNGNQAVHTYTPSLTIGSEINPMTAALMQRIENRVLKQEGSEWSGKMPSSVADGGIGHVQICTMQNLNSRNAEGERSEAMMTLAEKYPFAAHVSGWDMDHPLIAGKGPWTDFGGVSSFARRVEEHLFKDVGGSPSFQVRQLTDYKGEDTELENMGPGLFFPGLSEEDMKSVIKITKAMFGNAEETEHWRGLSDPEKAQAFMNTLGSVADYITQSKMMAKHGKIGKMQMCKQNIDRGAMGNMMLKALHLTTAAAMQTTTLAKSKIKSQRHYAMTETLARAQFVDDRALMVHRAEPFFNALKAFGTNSDDAIGGIIAHHVASAVARQDAEAHGYTSNRIDKEIAEARAASDKENPTLAELRADGHLKIPFETQPEKLEKKRGQAIEKLVEQGRVDAELRGLDFDPKIHRSVLEKHTNAELGDILGVNIDLPGDFAYQRFIATTG